MNYKTLLPLFVFVILLTPVVASAQFRPLVGIPGISDPNADFEDYINTLYAISISVAGLVAVIKIIVAGVKWMLSDLVSSKQDAKSDIQGALIGLLIIISAVLILEVINPQLTQSRLFLDRVDRAPGSGSGNTRSAPSTPAAPLPSSNTSQVVACAGTATPLTYDCSTARASCSAGGGIPAANMVGSRTSANSIRCETSRALPPIACNIETDAMGNITSSDCNAAIAQCSGQGGNYVENVSSITCVVPLTPPAAVRTTPG